tara:strand:- start:6801 stop:7919 length:1119 start_codon:yes stop_codon:yes gene_type:complete
MYEEHVDCVVVGAGVIGLAVARALALNGRYVLILESTKQIGSETSARNSEVIHAGIYYPKDSLKAKFCVEGKELLYRYLKERGIGYDQCGKLIVATNRNQLGTLQDIKSKAEQNGVHDLRFLLEADAKILEKELRCFGALLSPSTGILDTHSYMLSLLGDIENNGGDIVYQTRALSASVRDDHKIRINVISQGQKMRLVSNTLINASGLGAISFAKNIEGTEAEKIPKQHFAKGNYFSLTKSNPFKHLIYPVPEKAGLGIHLTIDLAGRARFGPDVEWVDHIDYKVNPDRATLFYPKIREYWPNLEDNALVPDYSGIRSKSQSSENSHLGNDFIVQGPETHNIQGLVNLFGIESPGLTASLAIADYVRSMVT